MLLLDRLIRAGFAPERHWTSTAGPGGGADWSVRLLQIRLAGIESSKCHSLQRRASLPDAPLDRRPFSPKRGALGIRRLRKMFAFGRNQQTFYRQNQDLRNSVRS